MEKFILYLKSLNLSPRTIEEHVKNAERFTTWMAQENYTDIAHIWYNDLLIYVQHLRDRGLCTQTLNIRINSVRKYFDHQIEEDIIEKNPARRLFIRGAVKKVVQHPLDYLEMENLYREYEKYVAQQPAHHHDAHLRSTATLGLMIWQGLHSGEIGRLERTHINLNEGTIYIPSSGRGNSRELKLEPRQVIALHRYMNECFFKSEKLFECNANNLVQHLTNVLKGINAQIKNAAHIRASVLLYWMKLYSKRQVQYMIGHKWISSTEYYERQDTDGLSDQLSRHHPFG